MTDRPKAGDIWNYPYLWARENLRGETEGRKPRPCLLAFLLHLSEGQETALLLAITSQPPHPGQPAIEVPAIEKRRAGLDHDITLWIILDERNEDIPQQSFYFEPDGRSGAFSASFTRQVQLAKINAIKARKSLKVSRRD